jgi:DNA-binding IclR family transcriptional regulator
MQRRKAASAAKPVGAVQAAIDILRHVANSDTPVGVNRIAEGVGRYPSTCYSILKTLEAEGFVTFDSNAKTYRLGSAALIELLHSARNETGFPQAARTALLQIAARFKVTIMISQRVRRDMMIVIDYVVPDRAFHINVNIGHRVPIVRGSMGRVVLGHENLTRRELEQLFGQFYPTARKVELEAWIEAVNVARSQGYVVDRNSISEGLTALSVPVVDAYGQSRRVVTAVGLTQLLDETRLKELGAELIEFLRNTKMAA